MMSSRGSSSCCGGSTSSTSKKDGRKPIRQNSMNFLRKPILSQTIPTALSCCPFQPSTIWRKKVRIGNSLVGKKAGELPLFVLLDIITLAECKWSFMSIHSRNDPFILYPSKLRTIFFRVRRPIYFTPTLQDGAHYPYCWLISSHPATLSQQSVSLNPSRDGHLPCDRYHLLEGLYEHSSYHFPLSIVPIPYHINFLLL